MRIIIVFVKLLVVFLMLMIPHVNSIEYYQVENTIADEIHLVDNEKYQIITSNKLTKIEKVHYALNEITNKLDGICFSCGEDMWSPKFLILLFADIFLTFAIVISLILFTQPFLHIIFLSLMLMLIKMDNNVIKEANELGCIWSRNIDLPNLL